MESSRGETCRAEGFLKQLLGFTTALSLTRAAFAQDDPNIEKVSKFPGEWEKVLTPNQYPVLREEGTNDLTRAL
jgi:hypothetical protein